MLMIMVSVVVSSINSEFFIAKIGLGVFTIWFLIGFIRINNEKR